MSVKVTQIQGTDPAAFGGAVSLREEDQSFSEYLDAGAKTWKDLFSAASEKYQVPMELLTAVGMQESGFKADAVSRAGAQGVMQLMPRTAAGLGVTDSFDPEQNINGGAKYLRELLDQYEGNIPFALAAYNAGSNNVDKYGGIPPFKETQQYVEKVMGYMASGVTLPDGTVMKGAGEGDEAYGAREGALTEGAEETSPENAVPRRGRLVSLLFSHDDYLKFVELFLRFEAERQEKKEDEDDSARFQNLRYTSATLSLYPSGGSL